MAFKLKTLSGLIDVALNIKTASGIVPVALRAKTSGGLKRVNGAAVSKLRVVTTENRVFNTSEVRALTNCAVRWPHVVGSAPVSDFQYLVNGWIEGANTGYRVTTNIMTIIEMSTEYGGVTYPVPFGAGRSLVVNPGDTEIMSGSTSSAALSLANIPVGTQLWMKAKLSVPTTAGEIPCGARSTSAVTGSQVWWYDPAVTTVSSVDVAGIFTQSGTAASVRTVGWCPMVVGHYVSGDPKTAIAFGNSITQGLGDKTTAQYMGWFQRLMLDADGMSNPKSSINCAVSGDTAASQRGNSAMLALAKYAKYGFEALLTNDLGTAGTAVPTTVVGYCKTIWNAMRAQGVTTLIRTKLLPRTTDKTQATISTGWDVGGLSKQVNDLLVAAVSASPLADTCSVVVDATQMRAGTDDTATPYYLCKTATFNGTIGNATLVGGGTILTATGVVGTIRVGDLVYGTGVSGSTAIVSQTSGTTGGDGVYQVGVSQLVATATAMTATMTADGTHPAMSGHIAIADSYRSAWDALS